MNCFDSNVVLIRERKSHSAPEPQPKLSLAGTMQLNDSSTTDGHRWTQRRIDFHTPKVESLFSEQFAIPQRQFCPFAYLCSSGFLRGLIESFRLSLGHCGGS